MRMETVPDAHPSRERGVWTLSQSGLCRRSGWQMPWAEPGVGNPAQGRTGPPAAWGQPSPGLGLCAMEREKGRFTCTLQRAEFSVSLQEHTELEL